MGPARTDVSSDLRSNARKPPPPPARPHAPPPYPSNGNATHNGAPVAPSRPPPPSKVAPVRPKPVPASRPEVEVGFKAVKPTAMPRE